MLLLQQLRSATHCLRQTRDRVLVTLVDNHIARILPLLWVSVEEYRHYWLGWFAYLQSCLADKGSPNSI